MSRFESLIASMCTMTMNGPTSRPRCPRGNAPAFTFVEVLFAIIILGVGMIMIAGVLPVAIKQNGDTRDELTGRAVCESGYAYMLSAIQDAPESFVPTGATGTAGGVVPLNFEKVSNDGPPTNLRLLPNLQLSRVSTADPRFQWTAFYRRDPAANFMKLIIISTRLRNGDAVDRYSERTLDKEGDDEGNGPFRVVVEVVDGGVLDPDRIRFVGTDSGGARDDWDYLVAAPGAYVIIDNSPDGSGKDPSRGFRNNGRVFRLSAQRLDVDATGRTWDLTPDYNLGPAAAGPDKIMGTPDDLVDGSMDPTGTYLVTDDPKVDAQGMKATAWIIGRGRVDPTAPVPDERFAGLAQDVGVLQVNVLLP